MEDKQQSPQFLRHRKFLMVVPLLIIPFLTMAFWALGSGKGNTAGAKNVAVTKGLNTTMPSPVLKNEKGFTKMSCNPPSKYILFAMLVGNSFAFSGSCAATVL